MAKKRASKSVFFKPLSILGAIVLGVIIWYSIPKSKPVDINWIGDASGTVTMSLNPATVTLTTNTESTLTLEMDTTTSRVTGAEVILTYDKSKIGTPVVTLGNFLPNVFVPVKITDSTISFTVASPPDSGGKLGKGTIATIKIKPPIAGTSSISFGEMIGAFAIGSQDNMMKLASDSTIVVTSPTKPDKPTNLRSNCFDGGKKITFRWDAVSGVSSYKLRIEQKDGNDDRSIDNIDKTEYETNIIPNQKYSWWVHSSKNGVDSDEAKVDNVECTTTSASVSPTPSPSPTTKPTVKPTIKPTAKPTTKPTSNPTVTPKPSSATTLVPASPITPGSLNDIFADKDALTKKESTTKLGFFQKVALGWQAILDSIANLFK